MSDQASLTVVLALTAVSAIALACLPERSRAQGAGETPNLASRGSSPRRFASLVDDPDTLMLSNLADKNNVLLPDGTIVIAKSQGDTREFRRSTINGSITLPVSLTPRGSVCLRTDADPLTACTLVVWQNVGVR